VRLDLALRAKAPDASQPRLLIATVTMRNPRDDGLSSSQESETLYAMEDAIVAALSKKTKVTYAGVITSDGKRRYFFYAPPAENKAPSGWAGKILGLNKKQDSLAGEVDTVMKTFPGYGYDCYEKDEPDWKGYLQMLYPNAWEMQTLMSLRVRGQMHSHGDQSHLPREIDHFIWCDSAEIQSQIMRQGEALGFRVVASQPSEKNNKYGVSLHKEGIPDDIDAITRPLFELAESLGADYDGWGAEVVTA
jgi:hypothetical protein